MQKRRFRAPSPAFVIALIALFVALGGTTYAATSLPKNSVGSKQLKKNAVTGPKIKKGAVTAAKINPAGLTVPSATQATNATTAANIAAPEAYHAIGATGEPAFQNSAHNFGSGFSTAGFFKDREGIVHLKGTVAETGGVIFTLPAGYRPTETLDIVVIQSGSASYVYVHPNGDVETHGGGNVGLDSISFRAEQ